MTNANTARFSLVVRLEAKAGEEQALADFLVAALPLANAERKTVAWFALRFGPSGSGIFDAFPDEDGRQAHLDGPIAQALMARADALLGARPSIEKVDVLAFKLSPSPAGVQA